MPLYEYKCHKCGKTFDALQKFSDEPLRIHDECGGEVERLISAPAFHFKGTGWYVTDYAKSNGVSTPAADGAKSETGATGAADSSSEGASKGDAGAKTEAKPETKTETKTEKKAESGPAPAVTTTSDK